VVQFLQISPRPLPKQLLTGFSVPAQHRPLAAGFSAGFPKSWGYPNSWMVFITTINHDYFYCCITVVVVVGGGGGGDDDDDQ